MKRKPAFAADEDPVTGEAVLGTECSSSFSLSPEQSQERRRSWRKSASDFVSDSESSYIGSLLDFLKKSKDQQYVTIVAGKNDDTREAWNECEKSGTKFRLFPVYDEILNGDSSTYIARQILLSKEEGDLDLESPDLIVAQRKYNVNGRPSLVAHRLLFHGRLNIDRPYIFPKLGDEIPGGGCPDMHVIFRGIRDWKTVAKKAKFVGFDSNFSIDITAKDVEHGRKIVFDFEKNEVVVSDVKPVLGVAVACTDFKPVYDGFRISKEKVSQIHPSPLSKKRRMHDGNSYLSGDARNIELKLIGMGADLGGGLKADLNLKLVLKE